MVKRVVLGLVKGLLVGGVVALVLVKGLGIVTFGAALAYVAAVTTGVLTGLVAGRPVWARGARIEAGVKAFAGALLAAGVMFAVRTWGDFSLDLSAFAAGVGTLGDLPIASLPLVATALALLFEVDNTSGDATDEDGAEPDQRAARQRVEGEALGEELELGEEEEAAERRQRR